MVQGTSHDYGNSKTMSTASSWEKSTAKRSGFEAVQRLAKEKQQKAAKEDNKYGAWGSTFKNKEHFADMHHC